MNMAPLNIRMMRFSLVPDCVGPHRARNPDAYPWHLFVARFIVLFVACSRPSSASLRKTLRQLGTYPTPGRAWFSEWFSKSLCLGSKLPPGPGKPFQKVGGEGPNFLEGFPGPPGQLGRRSLRSQRRQHGRSRLAFTWWPLGRHFILRISVSIWTP